MTSKTVDRLDALVDRLLPSAEVLATSTFVPLVDEFPRLRTASIESWDFFVTCAGVCVALSSLVGRVPDDVFREVYQRVSGHIETWDADAVAAIGDCREFVHRSIHQEAQSETVTPAMAVGVWVVWNVLGTQPSPKEAPLSHALGSLIGEAFGDWWGLRDPDA
jgi:hypothetical protein